MLKRLSRAMMLSLAMQSPPRLFSLLYGFNWYGGTMRDWVMGLPLPQGANVLELGCGPGDLGVDMAKLGYEVHGVDRSNKMISRASKHKTDAIFTQADAYDLPMVDNTYDAVLLSSLINVVPDRTKLLTEVHRVLKPGGVISALFPIPEFTIVKAEKISAKLNLPHWSSVAMSTWAMASRKLEPLEISNEFSAARFKTISTAKYLNDCIVSITAFKPKF